MQQLYSGLPGLHLPALADILDVVLSLLCVLYHSPTPRTRSPFLAAITGLTLHSQQGWW